MSLSDFVKTVVILGATKGTEIVNSDEVKAIKSQAKEHLEEAKKTVAAAKEHIAEARRQLEEEKATEATQAPKKEPESTKDAFPDSVEDLFQSLFEGNPFFGDVSTTSTKEKQVTQPAPNRKKRSITSIDIARWFVEKEGSCSEKKLQVLIWYAYVWILASEGKKVFDARWEADFNGIIDPVLERHIQLKNAKLPNPAIRGIVEPHILAGNDKIILPPFVISVLEVVAEEYGSKTYFELNNMIKSELPWKEARQGLPPLDARRVIINEDHIKQEYTHIPGIG